MAAVLLEPLQGEGGVVVPSSDYLAGRARPVHRAHGALLMLDEVQTGLGRTGRWFAFQAQALQPDVVTMAKALGNGMPVGRLLGARRGGGGVRPGGPRVDLRRAASGSRRGQGDAGRHGGRGRLRAGSAGRRPTGRRLGPPARGGLGPRGGAAPGRSAPGADGARGLAHAALRRGLLVNPVCPDALRLAPPLVVSDGEIEAALAVLRDVLVGR